MTTNNKISNLIYSQVPFFVKNDHPNFIVFLEKYYEYLEQTGKTVERAKNLPSFSDIDITEDFFADILYSQFINLLPRDIMADKSLVLKYAKDFYRSKGTENSIRFLLEVIFGIDVTNFYYPKTDILRASDGKWFIEKSIRIKKIYIDNVETTDIADAEKFKSRLITGLTSGATALVESVTTYYEAGIIIFEFKISNVTKEFSSNEIISATFEDNGVFRTITAETFGGIVSSVRILSGGSGYTLGSAVPVESNTGTGASVIISGVTKGNVSGIAVAYSGAGFVNGNPVLVTGGGGSGANANIAVIADSAYHPNSYTVVSSTINLEANTTIGNVRYTNLSSSNVNTSIINAVDKFVYGNTGPVNRVFVLNPGENYSSLPTLDIQANTRIRSLGILGRMEIVNGGQNYQINDIIEFINTPFCYGTGAQAEVANVDANGVITQVQFVQLPGHFVGGAGYTNEALPLANVVSTTGSNANIVVKTILGDGETLIASTETIGKITELTILSGGVGYASVPTLNLTSSGDGTAQANAEIITGAFTYPGRFLNDDGMISAFNYLENRDFYQNYSYVIRTNRPFSFYKKAIYDLVHPSGMKVFGEYNSINEDIPNLVSGVTSETKTDKILFEKGNYYTVGNANGSIVYINVPSHGIVANNNVYVEFISGSTTNLSNIQIVNSGQDYKNGYINIQNGSGSNANASIIVGDNGQILQTIINNRGKTYSISDVLVGNVSHLITQNVSNITINNGSRGYSNGYITFEGGSGRNANASVRVNANGAIVGVNLISSGTGYEANDVVIANVSSLITYNIASINIAATGTAYSNGYITFLNGSGVGANANVSVNATGAIVRITINNRGIGYKLSEAGRLVASVAHLKTYVIGELQLRNAGGDYSNGYISLVGGTGTGANAQITINPDTGAIAYINLNAIGANYSYGDSIYANVESLITYNVASINIINSGIGYSNGFINLSGGSGRNANASVTVNAIGAIDTIIINNRGTSYSLGDVVTANADNLLTYNVNSIAIANSGSSFSNGYVIFEGGSGRNANASVTVNANGAIVNVTINNKGTGYLATDNVKAKISHLASYNVSNVAIVSRGRNYSNGYIRFEGGSGFGANARINVNATGSIVSTTLFANGTGYSVTDYANNRVIRANVAHLGGSNANLSVILQFGNPNSADLSTTLAQYSNTANLGVSIQKGAGNANIAVILTANSNSAVLPITLQKFTSSANLSVSLRKGVGGANLVLNLQPEPLNTITNSIFLVSSSNTNWFAIQHPNTANIYGTSYSGILT